MEIDDFNIVDASNNAADQFPENMQFSAVNDNMRGTLGALARWYADINGSLETTGSGGAYALTTNRTALTLSDGLHVAFRANHTGASSAATLNITPSGGSALGTRNIEDSQGNTLLGSFFTAGYQYEAVYNTTTDAFCLINTRPALVTSGDVHTLNAGTDLDVIFDESPATNVPDIRMLNGTNPASLASRMNPILITGDTTLSAQHSGGILEVNATSSSVTVTFDASFMALGGAYVYYSMNTTNSLVTAVSSGSDLTGTIAGFGSFGIIRVRSNPSLALVANSFSSALIL